MHYVGIDVHQKQSTYCIMDEQGREIKVNTVKGSWDRLLFDMTLVPRPFAVCFEASTGYGYLHGQLGRLAKRVVVAHPGHLRLIFRSKRKNDRVDARKLAKQDESAGKNRLGHITRQGPATVRKLLVEASWQAIRRSPEARAVYERIRRQDRDRVGPAIVATAHWLLRVMLAMLKTGEVWRHTPPRTTAADAETRPAGGT